MKKEKRIYLLLVIGTFLISTAIYLFKYSDIPDFMKGLVFGVGIGLLMLFIKKKMSTKKLSIK
jgi:hypothetical protein